jgi:hypothetical protein
MSQFYVHLKGAGYGCDYNIGCNEKTEQLKATTLKDAEKEVAQLLDDEYTHETVEAATIFEAANVVEFDVSAHYNTAEERAKAELAAQKLAKDKALYEKLHAQFGNQ